MRPDNKNEKSFKRHVQKGEARYYGANACKALWQKRGSDIIRVYLLEGLEEEWREMLIFCAKERKPYHIVREQDLERLSDSVHHQGVCIVAKEKRAISFENYRLPTKDKICLLYLDGVQNPHNLGAIFRSAAHFGCTAIIGEKGKSARLSPAALRTAEGAGEYLDYVLCENGSQALQVLRTKGFTLFASDLMENAYSLYEIHTPGRSVFVMGGEVSGLNPLLRDSSDYIVKIPGTGTMQSLNVATAAALCLGEYYRQNQKTGTKRIVKAEK